MSVRYKKRLEALETDIDLRMHEIVLDALNQEDYLTEAMILAYMRAAYGRGYSDALKDKGQLIKNHYLKH